ncbi:MAG TPA: baseplate J/gp47 family protein [Candidatus Tectomicrobia bacterium]|nr:baseplate J/gp47 family protein [Candidatus Tectomicrobia bacterium]
MPLTIPSLDDRTYQELRDEALARIPVHTPEWTNFNESDPGVTLIELFAFLTENLLYRSNQIPERNRRKFLTLLGIPLQPAASARGLVTFTNDRGPRQTITLNAKLEVRAGQIPFRTEQGLDVLPIEAQLFYKRLLVDPAPELLEYYNQLYASFLSPPLAATAQLYETVPFPQPGTGGVDLGLETVDSSLWMALLVRAADKPAENTEQAREALRNLIRDKIGGKILNLGIVPTLGDASRRLAPGGQQNAELMPRLQFEMPIGGTLPTTASQRVPRYRLLDAAGPTDVLVQPGVSQITLPAAGDLRLWDNLDPLEAGAMDFPPALEDTNLNDRLLTWIRLRTATAMPARLLWAGINVTGVSQRAHVANELLPSGTGAPDQVVVLSKTPVLPDSLQLTITAQGKADVWQLIPDLTLAGPEVPVADPRQPPGTPLVKNDLIKVYTLNPESGEIRFGDGLRGARPAFGATIRADYDYGVGRDGNVNAGAINSGPALPAGLKVSNPVATWGGAEAETVSAGEKQISAYLQHRDRLVTATDFETVARRTPGVDIGRVEVLPAYNPELGGNEPGDAAGAVTLMIIPKYDPAQPDAPMPDRLFLDAICTYIDARRLVTTEVFLRGPIYKSIWVSVGISVIAGESIATVREAVKRALQLFLSPLPDMSAETLQPQTPQLTAPHETTANRGWPLRKPVVGLELMAVASRVPGVALVTNVLLAEGLADAMPQVDMRGLELPRLAGIVVTAGEPLELNQLRGMPTPAAAQGEPGGGGAIPQLVPIPVIPEECK